MHNLYEESQRHVHLQRKDPVSTSSSMESIPSEDSDTEAKESNLGIQRERYLLEYKAEEKRNSDQDLQLSRNVDRKSSQEKRSSNQNTSTYERYIHGHALPTSVVKSVLKTNKSELKGNRKFSRFHVFRKKKKASRRVTFSKSTELAIEKQLSDAHRNTKPRRIRKRLVPKHMPKPPVPDEDEFHDTI